MSTAGRTLALMTMADGAQGEEGAVEATVQKPEPTPLTIMVHSTPGYGNDVLLFRCLDSIRTRYNLVRVLAEQGSAVASLARHWCKRNGVRLTVVLRDLEVAEREDRARRWSWVVAQKPAMALFFNQADRWLEAARILHTGGVPVTLVRPDDQNAPRYIAWAPGMSEVPLTPSLRALAASARRGRPKQKVTEEHKRQVKAECTRRHDEKRRILKRLYYRLTFGSGRPKKVSRHG